MVEPHSSSELERLRQEVAQLQQAIADLEITLSTTIEHGDTIEAELFAANQKLSQEIAERQRAQATLQSILETVTRDKSDLELMLQTITEHGDALEYELYNRAVESMRQSEDQFRAIAEATPVAIILGRLPEGTIKYANTMLAELLDLEAQSLVNCPFKSFYHDPDDAERLMHQFNQNGFVRNHEILIKKANGSTFWASASLNPLIFQGEPTLLISLFDISQRKQVEAALRESEAQLREQAEYLEQCVEERTAQLQAAEAELRGLFAAMTEVILVVDRQGQVLKVASTNPDLLYKPTDEQLGSTLHEVFPTAQADTFLGHVQRALNHQETVKLEYSLHIQNREMWFSAHISPLSAETAIWVARDITERTQAEAALRESERQLRQQNTVLLDLAASRALNQGDFQTAIQEITEECARAIAVERVSIWLLDKNHSTLECVDLFEQTPNRHTQGLQLVAQDYPAYFQALQDEQSIAATDAQTDPRTCEFTENYLKPLNIAAMLDIPVRPGGQLVGVICFEQIGTPRHWRLEEQNFARSIADLVTLALEARERKRAELALQQAEEKYRSIFENAAEGIFQASLEKRYISANPALAQIYGYDSPAELLAAITDLSGQLYVQPRRWDELTAYMERFDAISACESQVYRQDGTPIWISENIRVVKDTRGQLLYYEGTVQDITARRRAEDELHRQRRTTERLLLNILPQAIAERLKQGPKNIADSFAEVTVLFADIVNFTELSSQITPIELLERLNHIFSAFDRLAAQYSLEKIKTIGDAYMVVGGVPTPRIDSAEAVADMALAMQAEAIALSRELQQPFALRIGMNTGAVVAGVIGTKKFSYDLWGDTVNVASRMESQGEPGKIQVTQATYARLKGKYRMEARGAIAIKGKGEMVTYWLLGQEED